MSEQKIETWIKSGYELLGTQGLDAVKSERLARVLNLNKSGFYHYFGTMEGFHRDLLEHHFGMAHVIASEIVRCQTIDPDLLQLIARRKMFFLADAHLLGKNKSLPGGHFVDEVEDIITEALVSWWQRNNEAPSDTTVAQAYLSIIRPFFYCRVNADNITYRHLQELAIEIKSILEKMTRNLDSSSNPRAVRQ